MTENTPRISRRLVVSMGVHWSYLLQEKMGNILFSSKIADLLPSSTAASSGGSTSSGCGWSQTAWSSTSRNRGCAAWRSTRNRGYTACTAGDVELKALPNYNMSWASCSDVSSCDKTTLLDDDTIYVDIQNGRILQEDRAPPCLTELISRGFVGSAGRRRQTLESFDERSWRQSFPQTMVFAVELYYNMHIIR